MSNSLLVPSDDDVPDRPPTLTESVLAHGFAGDVAWTFAYRPSEKQLVELLGGRPLRTLREVAY